MSFDLIVSIVVYKPKITILQETLDSLSKSNLNLKLIIRDNSPTPLDMKKISYNAPFNYFHSKSNLGYGKAHNKTISENYHLADYFLVLNPDVYFGESLLNEILQRMKHNPTIGLSIPKICHPSGHNQIVNRRIPRPQDYIISFLSHKFSLHFLKTSKYKSYQLQDFDTKKPFICPTISGCFMFFKSSSLKEVGGFDERFFLYLEDTDISRRISEKFKVVVFSDLVAFHHWSRGAYKSPKLFLIFIHSLFLYFRKWGWFRDSLREQLNANVKTYSSPSLKIKINDTHDYSYDLQQQQNL